MFEYRDSECDDYKLTWKQNSQGWSSTRLIDLVQHGDDVLIPVKVVPNASRDRVVGELDGALKLSVSAAPEHGAANKAVCRLLAKVMGLRSQQISVETGQTSPRKTIRIANVSIEDIKPHLSVS